MIVMVIVVVIAMLMMLTLTALAKTLPDLAKRMKSAGQDAQAPEDALPNCFKKKRLFTENEWEFLRLLETSVPEYRFFSQVAMGALMEPDVDRRDRNYFRLRGRFSQKIVDFVAVDPRDGSVVAIIELDDRSHKREKDAQRDAMLGSAGYLTVRWNSSPRPKPPDIRNVLLKNDQLK